MGTLLYSANTPLLYLHSYEYIITLCYQYLLRTRSQKATALCELLIVSVTLSFLRTGGLVVTPHCQICWSSDITAGVDYWLVVADCLRVAWWRHQCGCVNHFVVVCPTLPEADLLRASIKVNLFCHPGLRVEWRINYNVGCDNISEAAPASFLALNLNIVAYLAVILFCSLGTQKTEIHIRIMCLIWNVSVFFCCFHTFIGVWIFLQFYLEKKTPPSAATSGQIGQPLQV